MLELPDPPPKDNSRAAEVKKTYDEAISRATKFLISSAVILLILIAVVGQELREFRARQATLVSQIEGAAKREQAKRKELDKQIVPINKSLIEKYGETAQDDDNGRPREKSLSEAVGLEPSDIPKGTSTVHRSDEIDALTRGDQKLGELIRRIKERLDQNKVEQKGQSEAAWVNQARDLIQNLTKYRELYQERTDLARALLNVTKESNELKASKKSIPTPFGSFQIAPKLALFGLALALLLTYFPFYTSIRKIRGLANEYSAATGGDGSSAIRIPAPFWSPNFERRTDSPSSEPRPYFHDVVLSVSLHVIWIFFAAWLIYECIFTWKVTKALAFDFKSFWQYLLFATLAGAVFAASWLYVLGRWKSRFRSLRGPDERSGGRLKRRQFVRLGLLGVLGILGFGLFRLVRKQKGPRPTRQTASYFASASSDWVQNKQKKKTIHHRKSCKSHLPKRTNLEEPVDLKSLKVHAGSEVRILDDLGSKANDAMLVRRKQNRTPTRIVLESIEIAHGKSAVESFVRAIELSPLSMHLYDRLAKVYGTLESYDKIQPLYEGGRNKVRSQIAEIGRAKPVASTRKRLRFLSRTELTFSDRIEQVQRRKAAAEKWKASQQLKKTEDTNKNKVPVKL